MNLRRDDRLLERQARQNRRQPLRQHRLSRSRRPDHQDVVTAGSSDFESALRLRLTANVREVGAVGRRIGSIRRLRRHDARLGPQMSQQRRQILEMRIPRPVSEHAWSADLLEGLRTTCGTMA